MTSMALHNVQLPNNKAGDWVSVFIENGKFVEHLDKAEKTFDRELDLEGALILPGLVETHIHLDKACILSRCNLSAGTLQEAISQTSKAKSEFTEDDVYQRGASVLNKAIVQGTTHMRTHVEIDPTIGLASFNAVKRLKQDFAWAITLEICVFPQEGLLNNPGTYELLCTALDNGADVLGGCPYTDSDPLGQIKLLFETAQKYDKDLDFHLDFDLNPERMSLPDIVEYTAQFGWHNRVTVGHVTKLSAIAPAKLLAIGKSLAKAGVNVTALPSTDLFLNGRNATHNIPRGVAPLAPLKSCGVTCSISTNNLGNPFTPYGDASLVRQANLYANISHLGTEQDLENCLTWISTESAKLLRMNNYGLSPGCWADFIVVDGVNGAAVIAEVQQPLMGFKRGVQTFARPKAQILNENK